MGHTWSRFPKQLWGSPRPVPKCDVQLQIAERRLGDWSKCRGHAPGRMSPTPATQPGGRRRAAAKHAPGVGWGWTREALGCQARPSSLSCCSGCALRDAQAERGARQSEHRASRLSLTSLCIPGRSRQGEGKTESREWNLTDTCGTRGHTPRGACRVQC